jgi:hypothetical protein
VISAYTAFFAASAGAAAAFIGLLFVALSFIDSADASEKDRAWRRIMASSSFAQLTNIFFVSLVGLTPDIRNVAVAAMVMAVLGMLVAIQLLPKTVDINHSGRTRPSALGLIAACAYIVEFVAGVGLVHNQHDPSAVRYLIISMFILYAGALARAWEITGIKRR